MSASRPLPPSNSALIQDLESFQSFTMAHPRLVQAKDELLSAIEASAPGSLILVIGPTGVGKSTLRRRVESALIEKMAAEMEIDAGRIPFISIEAVAPDNGIFHWRDHTRKCPPRYKACHGAQARVERGEGERTANGRYVPGQEDSQAISCSSPSRTPSSIAGRPRYSSMRRSIWGGSLPGANWLISWT